MNAEQLIGYNVTSIGAAREHDAGRSQYDSPAERSCCLPLQIAVSFTGQERNRADAELVFRKEDLG